MWVSERHPNPPKQYAPPQPSGEKLLAISRGEAEELRLYRDEYLGHAYLRLGVWGRGPDGFRPIRAKSVTIRLRELDQVLGALQAVRDGEATGGRGTPRGGSPDPDPSHDRPRYVPPRRARASADGRPSLDSLPATQRADRAFDEFQPPPPASGTPRPGTRRPPPDDVEGGEAF